MAKVNEHQPPGLAVFGISDHSIFLAGPIQGAPDWQHKAVETFSAIYTGDEDLHLFNPRRDELSEDPDGELYKQQIKWEQDHLGIAHRIGGHMYWFAARNYSLPYPEGREYAKTSRKELGMSVGSILFGGRRTKLAIGIDPEFKDSERYFRTTLDRLGIPINTSLEDTCLEALNILGY